MIEINNITKKYSKDTVLDVLKLDIPDGQTFGLVGNNGAGKTTAIKILTGELKTTQGEVTKHPGLRLAYIAQHAFHHLEKHLHKTPTQYIMWRFAGNEDQEGIDMINKEPQEEIKKTKYYIDNSDGDLKICYTPSEEKQAVEPEQLLGRRENKKIKLKYKNIKFIPQVY